MRKKLVVLLSSVVALLQFSGQAVAASTYLNDQVAHAAARAQLAHASADYMVDVVAYLKKEVLLKDRMLRSPRHPANPNQVISVEKVMQACKGVVVSEGERLIVPAVCVTKNDYTLETVVIHLQTGARITIAARAVITNEDIAWISVRSPAMRSVPYVAFEPVAQGKSLQEVYGNDMTRHLQKFFHSRGVVERRRLRPGLVYKEPRLKVGEPLFYKGKLVALVKKQVRTYGGIFGGVSESAFAIIR